MRYRFFSINDPKKETLGVVNSETLDEAYLMASQVKNLPLDSFKELFKVEEITRMYHH